MSPSISRQLVFWLAIPLMLLALCGALVHYLNEVAPNAIDSDRRLREAASAVMAHLQVDGDRVTLDAGQAHGQPLPAQDSMAFALRDARGRLLLGDGRLAAIQMPDSRAQVVAMTELDHRSVRTLTTRFEGQDATVMITVADLRRSNQPAARFGLMSTLLWDFVQLDVTLVLVWIGIYIGLRPVRRLRDDIADRSPLDLRPIVEPTVPREIAPVVVTLNRLFGMLRSSAQSQQQFIANTAHQLRTPITGMQAQLELLIAEPAAQPVRQRLALLDEGIKQLAHSANQLLALARADPAVNVATKKKPVRLDTAAADLAARHFDRALRSGIDLGVELQPVSVLGDASLLDDLLSNLVDNALKYTPADGHVTISVGLTGGTAFVAVEDTGVGIPETERQRVRQRFYRMPNSAGHGSGLGLAIVDEIARLHEATVTISAGAADSGTRVQVTFH